MQLQTTTLGLAILLLALNASAARAANTFGLSSPAFSANGTIPHEYSYRGYGCDGDNLSPELHWSDVPKRTRGFALTIFDPDARHGQGWWHWIVFNLPGNVRSLPKDAGAAGNSSLPRPANQGLTDFQTSAYGGPCPPVGDAPHHYIFTLYALDVPTLSQATEKTSGPELQAMIRAHVVAKAVLTGRYARR